MKNNNYNYFISDAGDDFLIHTQLIIIKAYSLQTQITRV